VSRCGAVAAAGLAVLTASLAALACAPERPARWLVLEDPPRVVDAAVVLSGDPDYERTTSAARIVLRGEARLLVLTGGEPGPGDSAISLRKQAVSLGVPQDRIRMERTSRSTREGVLAVLPILRREGVKSVALVTSPYHQRRAYLAAQHAWPGIAILNRPAAPSEWTPEGWWRTARSRGMVVSEYLKLAYYRLRGVSRTNAPTRPGTAGRL
jgi:uncharacterized SAM-binding protein YcdF (DUF218 family)